MTKIRKSGNKKPTKNQKEMSKFGQDILDALHETLDFVKGKKTNGRITIMSGGKAIDIRGIRNELGMTREEFAKAFYFNPRTVQNWEQGQRRANDHTLAYLQVIAANPKGVYHTLHG